MKKTKTKTKSKHRKRKGGLFSWFTRKNEPLKNDPLKNEQNYTKHIGFVEQTESTEQDGNSFQNRSANMPINMPINRSNKFLNISYKEGEHLMDPKVIQLQYLYNEAERKWVLAKDASEDYPLSEKIKMDLQNAIKSKDLALQMLDRAQQHAFTEWNKTKTNIVVKSVETNQVYPKIVLLPCLQETKKGGLMMGYEYEQQPGHWDPIKRVMLPLFGENGRILNASDFFNRFWKTGVIPENVKVKVTKNGMLEIPNCSSYGFTGACKQLTCKQKWRMYAQYFKNNCDTQDNAALIVTHHNRMRNSQDNQALLPFKENENNGYANNFCLKIEVVEGKVINFSVSERGFPDKGSFETKGNKGYTYLETTENINLAPITEGIQEGLDGSPLNITMYIIRHGNAMHNKPMNVYGSSNRLDSILTPLGMLQAEVLGKKLESELKGKRVLLCSSFLQRTQMTGLLLLEKANQLPSEMKNLLISMKRQAYIRYNQSGFNKGFDNYSPLNEPLNEGNQEYTNLLNKILTEAKQMQKVGGNRRRTIKRTIKEL
jgi:hypothetical protein